MSNSEEYSTETHSLAAKINRQYRCLITIFCFITIICLVASDLCIHYKLRADYRIKWICVFAPQTLFNRTNTFAIRQNPIRNISALHKISPDRVGILF